MTGRIKKPLIAAIALSLITFTIVAFFGGSLGELGMQVTHINHFN